MTNGQPRLFRFVRILALLASGTTAGIVARGYAIAMPKMHGGVPASLTTAGEVSFFLLGAIVASFFVLLFAVSPIGREMLRSGTAGLACGVVIGLLLGAIAVPLFGLMFLTVPQEVSDFLMK